MKAMTFFLRQSFFLISFVFLINTNTKSEVRPEGFVIKFQDRKVEVLSPELKKKNSLYSVLIHNETSTDLLGKFKTSDANITFVKVYSQKSKTVEIKNGTNDTVSFVPLSPSFQEIPLVFGKASYEIPDNR